jgi:NAD(P)H-dependent FMN reductase
MATVQKRSRQARVLSMLEAQLKSGVKTEKKTYDVKIPLTESDRRRIEKEIELLKSKLV